MTTLLLTHPACLLHDTGYGHPERADRLRAIDDALAAPAFRALKREEAPLADLAAIQNDLFDLGADLATPPTPEPLPYEPLRIVTSQVERLERDIDALNEPIPALKSFVLPGGSPASAALHLARTVSRRAERLAVSLAAREGESVSPESLRYLNRLSDFLFVASRTANADGADDVLWVPGANR